MPHNVVYSPLRRRSSKKLPVAVDENELFPKNDDEAERLERRRLSGTISLKDIPVVPDGIADFTASEMVAHYASCIKLSTENKINPKNAFKLELIDYMTSMLKKKDSKMNNFQVASCTLDASTKIYASRVDRVYMDAFKMASGLGVLPNRKGKNVDEDGEADGDEGEMGNKKKAKKGPKKSFIRTEESLNAVTERDYRLDPIFMYKMNKFGDGQPGAINFMNRMRVRDDNCEMIMFPTEQYWQKQEPTPQASSVKLPTLPDISKKSVCSAFKGLFLSEDDSLDCMKVFEEKSDLDLEVDLETEADDHFEVTGIDEVAPEEDTVIEQGEEDTLVEEKPFSMAEVRSHLATKNQEYSYFNLDKISLWAGPGHWKIQPPKKDKLSATAVKNKKKEKKQAELDFDDIDDIPKLFVKGRNLLMSKQTMEKTWNPAKITNPIDEHYDPNDLTRLFFRKGVKFSAFMHKEEDVMEDNEVPHYDYNNLNDSQSYCPAEEDNDCDPPEVDDDPPANGVENGKENGDGEVSIKPADDGNVTVGWKLVSPPPQVPRVIISYAQKEKKLDMKKLKAAMWEVLTKPEPDKEKEQPLVSQENDQSCMEVPKRARTMLFSKMYQELVSRLPASLLQDLSMHIAFTALLHLANEKKLSLKGNEMHSDFEISQN